MEGRVIIDRARGLREAGAEAAWAAELPGGIAFLRHRLPDIEHRESSDWDVAVRDPEEAGRTAEARFGRPLVFVPKRFVIQRYFDWGQIDLLPVFEWQGITYLDSTRFWSQVRPGPDGLPRPCLAHDAFIVWMTGLLWGARYSARYDGLITRAARQQPGELAECLTEAFGKRLGGELLGLADAGTPGLAVAMVRAMRLSLWRQALRHDGWETLNRQAGHWRTELRHHLQPPYPWIAVIGTDGSGKSSVIAALKDRLKPTRLGLMECHWWPEPLEEGAAPGSPVTDPHARRPRGTLLSIAKTVWLGVRWWVARLGKTGHARSKRAMLISDRYYDDLLVDPRRYRYGAHLCWARWVFRLLPRPDRVLVLVGEAEEIHGRKGELPLDEVRRQIDAYRELAKNLGDRAVVIDAGQSLAEVVECAWRAAMVERSGGGSR